MQLKIIKAENGFIVLEGGNEVVERKSYVFDTKEALFLWIKAEIDFNEFFNNGKVEPLTVRNAPPELRK